MLIGSEANLRKAKIHLVLNERSLTINSTEAKRFLLSRVKCSSCTIQKMFNSRDFYLDSLVQWNLSVYRKFFRGILVRSWKRYAFHVRSEASESRWISSFKYLKYIM